MEQKIIDWAKQEKAIKTLILIGSRASNDSADELSDYDFSVFCDTHEPFIKDDEWFSSIEKVWVCVHEKKILNTKTYPTRLVVFEGGIKVDFSFFTLDVLKELVLKSSLPDEYNAGYSILLDKNDLAKNLSKPFGFKVKKPTKKEFQEVIKEFWFEAYHVAKYLKREDLWSVKFRSGLINDHFLLKMIEWNEKAKRNWECSIHPNGKDMHSWVSKITWKEISGVFAPFSKKDSWQALFNTMALFRKLAKETSAMLNFTYLYELDKNITNFIQKLHNKSRGMRG